jgi:hypothetical protein
MAEFSSDRGSAITPAREARAIYSIKVGTLAADSMME